MLKILFTGGGTGGHIYPIIAVARELKVLAKKNSIPLQLMFAGAADFGGEMLATEGIRVYRIPTGKIRRYFSWRTPWDLTKVCIGFIYSLFLAWVLMPDVIFAKGAYGSFAIALVGRLYGIGLIIHESDSVPGLVNRILGKVASRVALAFPSALPYFPSHKTAFVGNPIRQHMMKGDRERAKALFNLQGSRPCVLILGGSQGSTRINEVVAKALKELLRSYEVLHQCGTNNVEAYTQELKEIYGIDVQKELMYHLIGYLDENQETHALAIADVVISRAGAGSIFEIAVAGKPAIFIPLPEAAGDHQRQNAFFYARTGASVVIEEANLSSHILLNEIKGIIENKNRRSEMASAAKEFAKPEAAHKIAESILELAF